MRGRNPDHDGFITIRGHRHGEVVGDIELFYFTWGNKANPPVFFVQGMSTHGWWWALDAELACMLVDAGFYVIGIDNRDVGKSHKFTECPQPKGWALLRTKFGKRAVTAGYTLEDMALDYIEVMDVLGIEKTHLIGHSMGGMIAQILALEYPERVLSLCCLSTSCDLVGAKGCPSPPIMKLLRMGIATPGAHKYTTEDKFEAWWIKTHKSYSLSLYADPHYPTDEEKAKYAFRKRVQRDTEAGDYKGEGVARQLHAIIAATDRRERLKTLKLPTFLLHGTHDPIVPIKNGRTTANSIPGARFVEVKYMKHLLVKPHYTTVVEAVVEHHKTVRRKEKGKKIRSEREVEAVSEV